MFYMNLKLENGKQTRIRLDSPKINEISFSTRCGHCQKTIFFEEEEFYDYALKCGGYSSTLYCDMTCRENADRMGVMECRKTPTH